MKGKKTKQKIAEKRHIKGKNQKGPHPILPEIKTNQNATKTNRAVPSKQYLDVQKKLWSWMELKDG